MKVAMIIFSFILAGCGSLSHDFTGNYEHTHNWEFNTQLRIQPDMRYSYRQRLGNIWVTSEGRWQVVHDTLLLRDTLENTIPELKSKTYLIKHRKLLELQDSLKKPLTLKRR